MSEQVRISHRTELPIVSWVAPGKSERSESEVLSWTSDPSTGPALVSCTASFDDVLCFNSIQIERHQKHPDLFPDTFRFEISTDGVVWEPIIQESNYLATTAGTPAWHFPLIRARHLKFLFLVDHPAANKQYQAAFGKFQAMISGIVGLEVSSELDRLWVKENLLDGRPDYGWSTTLRSESREEYVEVDLGSINRVNEIRILTRDDPETFFPEVFSYSYSEDGISWHHLLEENGFLSESGTWYRWRIVPTNMRFLKMSIAHGAKTREGKFVSQLIELECYATADVLDEAGRSQPALPLNHASVLRSGIVRLALDGEVKEGAVVQAHDRRLKDATSESSGIVELATDGEERSNVVVQGNDRRLKLASEDLPGIVRLARNNEVRAGHVVQSNDERLAYADEEKAGLVELAEDGENRPGVVVQGSDRRLRLATSASPGIVQLAENGATDPNLAVQADDHRLRDASTEHKGILRFAREGENAPDAAVQGSDPRLAPATTEARGIVELARDGEDGGDVVVQGNDSRLKAAREDRPGIVELAAHGSSLSGRAVQADDPRLSDHRHPLPHKHDYAPREHDFSSHTGVIELTAEMGSPYDSFNPPPQAHAPIAATNRGGGAGLVGRGKFDGVIGAGGGSGVRGIGEGEGSGVRGLSSRGPGGDFVSKNFFSIVAGSRELERGLGILARGYSQFEEAILVGSGCVAAFFHVDSRDVYAEGDLVVVQDDKKLRKSRESGGSGCVGAIVERAGIILNAPDDFLPEKAGADAVIHSGLKPKGMELVAISGIVQMRTVAEKTGIKAGDLLVTSIRSGCAEKLDEKRYRPGTIIGRALEPLPKGEGIIRALLLCS